MTQPRWDFEKVGMGYRLWADDAGVEMHVGRLKRSGQELSGELRVKTRWEGVKTVDGVLHQARFNFSSATTRNTLAKILKARTESSDGFKDMDWSDALEHLCQYVLSEERKGEPLVSMNGTMPDRRQKYAIFPIAPHNVASILYGPGGIGKSVMALALALSVAKGQEIVPGFAPATKGPVLYLDWETDPYVVRERVEMIAKGHQFKPTKDLSYRRCSRPLADDAEELAAVVADRGIKFVVIDSTGPAMGTSGEYGDANEGTLKLFNAIRHLGVTVLLVDHVSKQEMRDKKGQVTGHLPYGSIYKVNLARATWELINATTDDDDDVQIRLMNTKANDSRLHDPIDLTIRWETGKYIAFSEGEAFEYERQLFPSVEGMSQESAIEAILAKEPNGLTTSELAGMVGTTANRIRVILGSSDRLERGMDKRIRLVDPGAMA